MEEKESLTLAKSRLYRKIDEIEQQRQQQRPTQKQKPASAFIPLLILFLFLIVVIFMEERALYNAEAEITSLRSTITAQVETIRLANDRILAFEQETQSRARPEPLKRRPVKRRKPPKTGQALDFANGYGLRGN
jgi:hypothetical protein